MGLLSSCLSLPPRPSPGINDLDKNSRQNLESMRLIRKLLSRSGLTPVVGSQQPAVSAVWTVALADCLPRIALLIVIALSSSENVGSSVIFLADPPSPRHNARAAGASLRQPASKLWAIPRSPHVLTNRSCHLLNGSYQWSVVLLACRRLGRIVGRRSFRLWRLPGARRRRSRLQFGPTLGRRVGIHLLDFGLVPGLLLGRAEHPFVVAPRRLHHIAGPLDHALALQHFLHRLPG